VTNIPCYLESICWASVGCSLSLF